MSKRKVLLDTDRASVEQVLGPRGRQGRHHSLAEIFATPCCALRSDAAHGDQEICEELTTESRTEDCLVFVKQNQPVAQAAQESFLAPRNFRPPGSAQV